MPWDEFEVGQLGCEERQGAAAMEKGVFPGRDAERLGGMLWI